ncbi:MAG: CHASE domain-containing protein [Methylococcales bacterium]|nr:CHASE domain-containing protein [Methylococcales bacterium]
MKTTLLTKNLLVALGYFVGALLGGIAIGASPQASPIWPAAGIALAAVFLYGNKILPGLFIGALLAQFYSFQDLSTLDKILDSLLMGVIFALASTAQAFLGLWLINKNHIKHQDPLIDDHKILKFLFYGGFVSTTLAATIATIILLTNSIIALDESPITWVTWWIGDSVGVYIFTPFILAFFAKPKLIWKQRIKTVVIPQMVILICLLTITMLSVKQEQHLHKITFDNAVSRFHGTLVNDLADYLLVSKILKGIFDSSLFVSKEEFSTFTAPLLARHSNLLALEWIPLVRDKDRKKFEQEIGNGFSILESTLDRQLIPAKKQAYYYPILYAEPINKNRKILGFDIINNPNAEKLLNKIKETRQTLFSSPIWLLQDNAKMTAYIVYSPVYNKKDPLILQGVVASVFKINQTINQLYSIKDSLFNLQIEDQKQIVYSNYPKDLPHGISFDLMQQERSIDLTNRQLIIRYIPSINHLQHQKTWTVWLLLLGGFLFSSVSSIGLLMLTGHSLRTENLIKQRTAELSTAKKTLQNQNKKLQQANKEVLLAVKAKDIFLSNMSHELRTPLNAVLGFAQILEMEPLSKENTESVQYILKSGQHLLHLINDVLDLTAITSGNLPFILENIAIDKIVKDCLIILRPLADKKGVTINTQNISPCYITADSRRLQQVIINLLSNAIKYNHPQGSISLSLDSINNRVRLKITDTGIGITKNKLKDVFVPFNRLGQEMSTIEGTGIGLTICKELVKEMSGEIGVESQEGIGSTFWVEFDCIS